MLNRRDFLAAGLAAPLAEVGLALIEGRRRMGLGDAQAARVTAVLAARLRQPEFERLPLMWEAFRAMLEGRFDALRADRFGDGAHFIKTDFVHQSVEQRPTG